MPLKKNSLSDAERKAIVAKVKARRAEEEAKNNKAAGKQKPPQRETAVNWRGMQDDVAKLKQQGGTNFIRLQQGESKVRLLMTPEDSSFYACRLEVYMPVGGKNGKGQTLISPRTENNSAYCPLSVVSSALYKAADSATSDRWRKRAQTLAGKLRPRSRYLSNALVDSGSGWQQGVLEYGPQVFQGIATGMKHLIPDDAVGDDGYLEEGNIAHPDKGTVMIIERTGAGLKTEYAVTLTPRGHRATDEQLAARVDVNSYCTPHGDEVIEDALCEFFGVDDFDDISSADSLHGIELPAWQGAGDDEEEKKGAKRKGSAAKEKTAATGSRKRKPPVEEDDDDDEDDEDIDDADEEDEDASGLEDVPPCIGSYGEPEKGYKCKGCEHASLCKELSRD